MNKKIVLALGLFTVLAGSALSGSAFADNWRNHGNWDNHWNNNRNIARAGWFNQSRGCGNNRPGYGWGYRAPGNSAWGHSHNRGWFSNRPNRGWW